MLKIELTKEELLSLIDKKEIARLIVNNCQESIRDAYHNEFKDEIYEQLRITGKELAKEYMDAYEGKDHIESQIDYHFKNISSKKLLEIILEKM